MSDRGSPNEPPDDIDAYIATLRDEERDELAAAEAAIDIAILLNRARRQRGLSQKAAAERAGLQQQAVSRFESPDANPRLETVQAYLGALGFALEMRAIDVETGNVAATALLSPAARRSA
jgi:DNA-binding phage protein